MVMFAILKKLGLGVQCKRLATAMPLILLAASTVMPAAAQHAETTPIDHKADPVVDHYYEPLPQETGAAAGIAIEAASRIRGIAVATLWHTTPDPNFLKIANMTI